MSTSSICPAIAVARSIAPPSSRHSSPSPSSFACVIPILPLIGILPRRKRCRSNAMVMSVNRTSPHLCSRQSDSSPSSASSSPSSGNDTNDDEWQPSSPRTIRRRSNSSSLSNDAIVVCTPPPSSSLKTHADMSSQDDDDEVRELDVSSEERRWAHHKSKRNVHQKGKRQRIDSSSSSPSLVTLARHLCSPPLFLPSTSSSPSSSSHSTAISPIDSTLQSIHQNMVSITDNISRECETVIVLDSSDEDEASASSNSFTYTSISKKAIHHHTIDLRRNIDSLVVRDQERTVQAASLQAQILQLEESGRRRDEEISRLRIENDKQTETMKVAQSERLTIDRDRARDIEALKSESAAKSVRIDSMKGVGQTMMESERDAIQSGVGDIKRIKLMPSEVFGGAYEEFHFRSAMEMDGLSGCHDKHRWCVLLTSRYSHLPPLLSQSGRVTIPPHDSWRCVSCYDGRVHTESPAHQALFRFHRDCRCLWGEGRREIDVPRHE